ncbi:hypothetical protein [Corynebacterium lactis]|uniref:Uncharacterized protein n=1 Tax=Corynebacterium lactis RW2-5 TaxID=1408189 RepID=A0A0K2GZ01_9CORY|nr:hypothetical protein [Corynebacterium lactis]ALA67014.1 hypothetical protein CLAC_04030 [Corynebacterium lactis RW2-5]
MKTSPENAPHGYLFVWGDTVIGVRLAVGVIVGIVCALVGLYGGRALIGAFVADPELAKAWSLVTGLVGCVFAGVVLSWLFPPARRVTEDSHDVTRVQQAVAEIADQPMGLGDLQEASKQSRAELADAGLTEWFDGSASQTGGSK